MIRAVMPALMLLFFLGSFVTLTLMCAGLAWLVGGAL